MKIKPMNPKDKIITIENRNSIHNFINEYRKIVFTNGCFDVFHFGHAEYLYKARQYGEILIVGLNNDKSVRKIKGQNRPINNEYARAYVLASLMYVDYVVLFEEDTPRDLIQQIMPTVLIKGGDYDINEIVGADIVKSIGGEVYTIPFIEGYSSSSIINKMNNDG